MSEKKSVCSGKEKVKDNTCGKCKQLENLGEEDSEFFAPFQIIEIISKLFKM